MSKARQKIDPQIRDMFDSEVDRPDHDQILTKLFGDDAALHALLMAHELPDPLPSFSKLSKFKVVDELRRDSFMGYEEAVTATGITPEWVSTSPLRITGKQLESPLSISNDNGRYSRIVGFVDIVVGYVRIQQPTIYRDRAGKSTWQKSEERRNAMIEVKGQWPTAGNLIRQLNLYSLATAAVSVLKIVVGPDDSMRGILDAHGYRLATFDVGAKNFKLLEQESPSPKSQRGPGQF